MNRFVPQPTSLDPIELGVWTAEFVRARNNNLNLMGVLDQSDHGIDKAISSANTAVADLRKAYKR